MDSEKNPGGRPSNEEITERKEAVRDLLLQGKPVREIAAKLGISTKTVQVDIVYWKQYYRELGMNHPEVIKIEAARVQEKLSEIDIVKKRYWDVFNRILAEQDEQDAMKTRWLDELAQCKKDYQAALAAKDRPEIKRLEKQLKELSRMPRFQSLYRAQLDNLKLIMDRIDKEAKLLNLFNPGLSQREPTGLSLETFKQVMLLFKQLIMEGVPDEARRAYIFQRLRNAKLDELSKQNAVDADLVTPEIPKQLTQNKVEEPSEESSLEDLDI